jgi:molybdenum cofactor cytidylyltransferase
MNNTGIVILAAGNSSRLGQPKQLLSYEGSTLISRVAAQALDAALYPVVVVTGAVTDEITHALAGKKTHLTHNARWQEGMGTSIAVGLTTLQHLQPDAKAVIITLCDQPHLSATLFQTLITTQASTNKGIVASSYSGTIGAPALFTRPYFAALSALSGNEGARKLLLRYREDLAVVPFPEGAIDIDTPEDYQKFLSGKK